MSYWTVALTKSARENTAAENLTRQGFGYYLPKYISLVGKKPQVKMLFPRYIFIFVEHQFHAINSTFGISRLIMSENSKPAVVPDKIIEELRSREGKSGLITLPQPERFQVGTNVKLADGPLAGYTLLYDGMSDASRASVLLELLGRKVSIEVDEKDLVKA
jgi:transcriptional antiterminator RfaH